MRLLYTPSFVHGYNSEDKACWVYTLDPHPRFFGLVIKREDTGQYWFKVHEGRPVWQVGPFATRGQAARGLFMAWRRDQFRKHVVRLGTEPALKEELDKLDAFMLEQEQGFRRLCQ